jgi:hypothetical protein
MKKTDTEKAGDLESTAFSTGEKASKRNKSFAGADVGLNQRDVESLLRCLWAGFYTVDPYGFEYGNVMSAIEHALAYFKLARECNV